MIYYTVASGSTASTPWRIPNPDGSLELIKSLSEPSEFTDKLTADEARTLAAEWAPDLEEENG